jgi:hypothetical protein
MAKIVLKQGNKSFTIITHEQSKFYLPCLGEDGQLYWLFNLSGVIRDDMDFLDEKQGLCVQSQYKMQHHKEPLNSQIVSHWDKAIFDNVNSLEEYIRVWKKKNNKEWINE